MKIIFILLLLSFQANAQVTRVIFTGMVPVISCNTDAKKNLSEKVKYTAEQCKYVVRDSYITKFKSYHIKGASFMEKAFVTEYY